MTRIAIPAALAVLLAACAGTPTPSPAPTAPPPAVVEEPAPPVPPAPPAPPVPAPVVVEDDEGLPRPPEGTLGTGPYQVTAKEKPFFDRLSTEERAPGRIFGDYDIRGKTGAYVGWFGILRAVREEPEKGITRLLVENKYFDGMQDTHILCTSFYGAGDFVVEVPGTGHTLVHLSMVRAYGTVASEKDGVPRLRAEYVRHWDFGLYTFLAAYGKPKGNREWEKLCQVPLDGIYQPFPRTAYYEKRLGTREDCAKAAYPIPE